MTKFLYAVPALLALAAAIAADTPAPRAPVDPRAAAALALVFAPKPPPAPPAQDKHDTGGDPFAPANKAAPSRPPSCGCGDCPAGKDCPGGCDRTTCVVPAKKPAKSPRADGRGFCSDQCTCGCNDGLPCRCGSAPAAAPAAPQYQAPPVMFAPPIRGGFGGACPGGS